MIDKTYPFNIIEYNIEVPNTRSLYNVTYIDENGQLNRLDQICGSWRKLIVIPKGSKIPLHLSTLSYESIEGKMHADIRIDGKVIQADSSDLGIVNILSTQ